MRAAHQCAHCRHHADSDGAVEVFRGSADEVAKHSASRPVGDPRELAAPLATLKPRGRGARSATAFPVTATAWVSAAHPPRLARRRVGRRIGVDDARTSRRSSPARRAGPDFPGGIDRQATLIVGHRIVDDGK